MVIVVGDDFGVTLDNFIDAVVDIVGLPITVCESDLPEAESAVGANFLVCANGSQTFRKYLSHVRQPR
ncbi:MAG: hypothetical protein ACO3JF_06830 [Ilumatobacteraceae bacterium]